MLSSYCQVTEFPGGGCWAAVLSLWRTKPGAGGGSGCEEEAGGVQGRGLRRGKDAMAEGMPCTCPGAEVEGVSEGG